MVVLVVLTGHDTGAVAPVLAALDPRHVGQVATIPSDALGAALTDDLLASLAAVVVVADEEPEAGHRACLALRDTTPVPLCMVSMSAREVDELMAFANGCDEYIRMPCSARVLHARLGALLAWGGDHGQRVMVFGCLRLDPRLRSVSVAGTPLAITRTEFDILVVLMANQRRVVTREELVDRVWSGCPINDHALDVHMSRLRTKVLHAGGPKLGDPVAGVGYRIGQVTCSPEVCRPNGALLG